MKILIADDNYHIRAMTCKALAKQGYAVTAVSNGNDAIRLLNKERFALVISDIFMPEKDGLELIIEIHKNWPESKNYRHFRGQLF